MATGDETCLALVAHPDEERGLVMLINRCLATVLLTAGTSLLAQSGRPIDATVCFSDLLQNHYDFSQNINMKYRLYSLWNRDLYEASKNDTSAGIGPANADYDQSTQKVLHELQENNQSTDFNKATALHVATLDPKASDIIKHCLNNLTSGYGIFTKVENEDERYLDVTIYWRSTEGHPLKFKKQEIFNGVVLDDHGSHPALPLISGSGRFSWGDPAIPSGSSRTIRIERKGPYDRVLLKFVTSPDLSFETIPAEPVSEKVVYVMKEVTKVSGVDLHGEWVAQTWVNNNGLTQTFDDRHGHKHYAMKHNISELSHDPTAVFTRVRCEKYGSPQDFADLDGATPYWNSFAPGQGVGTSSATCTGWWQETGRSMRMVADYQVTRYEPQLQKWAPWH